MPVRGGHQIFWEVRGNQQGIPAVVLHGGPGSGCKPGHFDLFDLDRYRVVLMDQRGAGRSTPFAGRSVAALENNTTDDLLADLEQLRAMLDIEHWLVFGGSWGTTLGLLYAQQHPDRVAALVLAGVATTDARDLQWLYGDIGNLFPEAFHDFCAFVPQADGTAARIAAYGDALLDPAQAQAAADAWCRWELAIFDQDFEAAGWTDPAFRLGFARVVTHYFRNATWRKDNHILDNMDIIAQIPGVMIHSRFDPSCPLRAPWELSRVWAAATLKVLGGNDHTALSDGMRPQIRDATDDLAARLA